MSWTTGMQRDRRQKGSCHLFKRLLYLQNDGKLKQIRQFPGFDQGFLSNQQESVTKIGKQERELLCGVYSIAEHAQDKELKNPHLNLVAIISL